jgi:predicted nuclease of predicted toxin-antitoxin system
MARFYSNENFPKQAADELTQRFGHDVLTALAAGNANRAVPDEEVLAFAASEERILLTFNRLHFLRLHREFPNHAGIVLCTFDSDFSGQARRIHDAVEKQGEMKGNVVRVNRPGTTETKPRT